MAEALGSMFGRRVRRERESRGWGQRDLERHSGIDHVRIQRIETNSPAAKVTLVDAVSLAQAFGIPVSSLVNGPAIRERVLAAARTRDENSVEDAIDAVMPVLELAAHLDAINFPRADQTTTASQRRGSEPPSAWGMRVAAELRTEWGMPQGPLHDLARTIETHVGVMVVVCDMPDGVDGITLSDPETDHKLLAVRRTENWERQRFTLAHELGHLLAGDAVVEAVNATSGSKTETAASEFARNLLVPTGDLLDATERSGEGKQHWTAFAIARTAWEYQVSPAVLAIQLERLKLISRQQGQEASGLSASQWGTLGGWAPERESLQASANTPRVPQPLMERAIAAWQQSLLHSNHIARLLNAEPEEVTKLLDDLHVKAGSTNP